MIRQLHRWASALFTLIVAGIFAMLGLGSPPADWVYYLPLAPLAVLMPTGAWLFLRPYLHRRPAR